MRIVEQLAVFIANKPGTLAEVCDALAAERVNIYEIMSKPAITLHQEMDVRYAARLFARFKLSRAPVVNHEHEVVGIVSLTDMVFKGLCHQ